MIGNYDFVAHIQLAAKVITVSCHSLLFTTTCKHKSSGTKTLL